MKAPPLLGLVLAGGRSRRMGRDKAALEYGGQTQLDRACCLLDGFCAAVFVSVRADQSALPGRGGRPTIVDGAESDGPAAGLLAALRSRPDAAWLVLACDLPLLTREVLAQLIAHRDPARPVTAFASATDGLPEPLCAIYEPAFRDLLEKFLAEGCRCPRKMLIRLGTPILPPPDPHALDNVNEPADYAAAAGRLGGVRVRVRYFASLRERAGIDAETVTTLAPDARSLYDELTTRHRFTLPPDRVRVAFDGAYVPLATPLQEGREVLFIPPVAGG